MCQSVSQHHHDNRAAIIRELIHGFGNVTCQTGMGLWYVFLGVRFIKFSAAFGFAVFVQECAVGNLEEPRLGRPGLSLPGLRGVGFDKSLLGEIIRQRGIPGQAPKERPDRTLVGANKGLKTGLQGLGPTLRPTSGPEKTKIRSRPDPRERGSWQCRSSRFELHLPGSCVLKW